MVDVHIVKGNNYKKMYRKKENKITILLFLMLISMTISIICHTGITRPNEINYIRQTKENLNPIVKFDYINGLWLAPSGLFFILLVVLTDILKKDIKF